MDERERIGKFSATRKDGAHRVKKDGFTYPYGAYPENSFSQIAGYDSKYIKEGKYFYYQIAVSHERIMPVLFTLLKTLPEKSFIVTQIHTDDYYKENDTYVSEGQENVIELIDWIENWKSVVLDDGFFGIGAFTEGLTAEVFLDEHKTIHVYHHDPDLIENKMETLGVPFVMDLKFYWDEPHYHESLPVIGEFSEDYLTAFEDMADKYELLLDDDEENIDHEGYPVGMTCWKVEVRGYKPASDAKQGPHGFYSTLYLNAESRGEAADLVEIYMESKDEYADLFLQIARVPIELLTSEISRKNHNHNEPGVWNESERIEFEWGQPLS